MAHDDRSAPDRRVFLGLEQAPLIAAATWLLEHPPAPADSGVVDLGNHLVVLPTHRATERLLQLLVGQATEAGKSLIPPRIITVGQYPEYLYVAEKPLASDLAQELAWSQALLGTSAEDLEKLTGRSDAEPGHDWQPLAHLISRLHARLANDIWSFRSVAREVQQDPDFLASEAARWDVLSRMQQRYYSILDDAGLWDRQAARNYAAAGLIKANELRCQTEHSIVLLGVADLSRSVAEMTRQIMARNRDQVTVLVAAEASMSDRFDDLGSLQTERWLESEIEIDDSQIRFVDQPADQASAIVHYLATLGDSFATDQITIGVPDPAVVPQLQRRLNALDLPHRHLAGRPLSETAPVRLLVAVRDYLDQPHFGSFASLVRHPDLFLWLVDQVGRDDWLADLDTYQNEYLPNRIPLEPPAPFGIATEQADDDDPAARQRAARHAETCQTLNRVHQAIVQLIGPLDGPDRRMADWADAWRQILLAVYGSRELDPELSADRQILLACEAMNAALGDHTDLPPGLNPLVRSREALGAVLDAASDRRVLPPAIPEAIELAGWLDLSLDDAPVLAVASMNDEQVPSSEQGHTFLPNELCRKLGILDNDRRFARDACALTVLHAVRKHLLLVVGRRNEVGDPLRPSRLLFATDRDRAARRAKAFFSYSAAPQPEMWIADRGGPAAPDRQQLAIPRPVCQRPLDRLSVTKFRSFLECRYRFYLQHVLKLDSATDDWDELSGGTFGDLCHEVLETFGRSSARDFHDAGRIEEFLLDTLSTLVDRQFSRSGMPAVTIQVEQLRMRLSQFAPLQAAHRRRGWQIVSTEEMLEHAFPVDGQPFTIRGKIDRVDRHESTGQVAVWDYKSSDAGESAERKHYAPRKQQWKDLQLPLYRHLVKEVAVVADADFSNLVMGYILLPKKLELIQFDPAHWSPEELHAADEVARDVIRQIRNNHYWPPEAEPPRFADDFAAICQDRVFEQFEVNEPEVAAPW